MKHIHFIGICGVAMSALALALHKKGYKVSGSDVGFYPPVSTMLQGSGIDWYAGWHPEKMGTPDLVIVGNVAGSQNPEWLTVQAQKIPYKSYPEAIAEFWLRDDSIVCAGTYGKTTTTALLSWIFTQAGLAPSYMFGGLATGDFASAALNDGKWSILEGDEYKSARWDNGPKFAHYKPKFLLLTAVSWDHVDVYPTEASYLAAFEKLVHSVPAEGLIAVSTDNLTALEMAARANGPLIITYGTDPDAIYSYRTVTQSPGGLQFEIVHMDKVIATIKAPLLGVYQAENITGAFAMAHQLMIEPDVIVSAIASFPGLKRRLEKRFDGAVTVFDDIAHSPAKAKSVLENLHAVYSDKKIIAVFEPNTGNRKPDAKPLYANAFAAADEVIIPRLTRVKIDADDAAPPIDGPELTATIAQTHSNAHYFENDDELVAHLAAQANSVIVFLGSHGFRGMIENLIAKL